MPSNDVVPSFLSSAFFEELARIIDTDYPLVHDPSHKPLKYGTAGFRTDANLLPPVAARVSMIAALRSIYCQAKRAAEGIIQPCYVGFMITASHNPYADNGFKIIDADGGMLTASWEQWCTAAANATTGASLESVMKDCIAQDSEAFCIKNYSCCCVRASMDTRPSFKSILEAAQRTFSLLPGGQFSVVPVNTTPYLHFDIEKRNRLSPSEFDKAKSYYDELLSSFEQLYRGACGNSAELSTKSTKQQVVVDCANGVGAIGLRNLFDVLESKYSETPLAAFFDFHPINVNITDERKLNYLCGADYAKQSATPSSEMLQWPKLCSSASVANAAHYYCLDGDADRVVAFLHDARRSNNWVLLDGDRISILYAMLLHKWLGEERMKSLDIAVVQTAYANGASTEFLEKHLHTPVLIAATGVKNLHPVAHARDIGVYFEANGHGTVLISNNVASDSLFSASAIGKLILSMRSLLSQSCGDAIADMLMCEVALKALNMTFEDWADLYVDRPCKQTKVTVAHPERITNTEDERKALSPPGLQEEIDKAVSSALSRCEAARAFVRPSGTEPVVRVYAEATDQQVCDSLSVEISKIVEAYCN